MDFDATQGSPLAATCYRHPQTEAGISCQRCERTICPTCMIPASVGFQCPECVHADPQKTVTMSSLEPSFIVSKGLIAINAVLFLATMVGQIRLSTDFGLIGTGLTRVGRVIPDFGVAGGEWWRIVTSGFLHANLMHVGFNMYLLWQLGRGLERRFGPIDFAVLYFVGLLGGSFGALLLSPFGLTIGASGAVYGLMGALVVTQYASGMNPMQGGIGGLLVINLLITFAIPNISVGGHIGGLVGGAVVGALYAYVGGRDGNQRLATIISVLVGLAFLIGCFAVAGAPFGDLPG